MTEGGNPKQPRAMPGERLQDIYEAKATADATARQSILSSCKLQEITRRSRMVQV